jgi:imidazolonepropionase-like amidohydrolase
MAVMKTILSHANLIDCVERSVRPDTAVLIENGRIRAILPRGEAANVGDAQVIDLKGGYLMPGLWDVHIHPDYLSVDAMPLADQVTLFGHRLASALTESGIVGMRCASTHSFMDVAWKRAFDSGQHVGPRLFACGHFLTTTGGHFLTSGHALEVDGPYGWVKAIREQIKNGVHHIKLPRVQGKILDVYGMTSPARSSCKIYGGLVNRMPLYAVALMVFILANVGLPGTSGFVGEFLSLQGAFRANSPIGATNPSLGK